MDYDGNKLITTEDIYNPNQSYPESESKLNNISSHLPYDLDSNQAITLEEYKSSIKSQLSEIDINSDEMITLSEYRKARNF